MQSGDAVGAEQRQAAAGVLLDKSGDGAGAVLRPGSIELDALRLQLTLRYSGYITAAAVNTGTDAARLLVNKGDALIAHAEQKLRGVMGGVEVRRGDVVQLTRSGETVDQNDRQPGFQFLQQRVVAAGSVDNQSVHPVIQKVLNGAAFARRVLPAVGKQHLIARLLTGADDALEHDGGEDAADVGDDAADEHGLLRLEPLGGAVGVIIQARDHSADALLCGSGHVIVFPVKVARDRRLGYAAELGNFVDCQFFVLRMIHGGLHMDVSSEKHVSISAHLCQPVS